MIHLICCFICMKDEFLLIKHMDQINNDRSGINKKNIEKKTVKSKNNCTVDKYRT
jgi:hypothetical protein